MDPVHTAFLHALSSGYQFTEAFGVVPELDWPVSWVLGMKSLSQDEKEAILSKNLERLLKL